MQVHVHVYLHVVLHVCPAYYISVVILHLAQFWLTTFVKLCTCIYFDLLVGGMRVCESGCDSILHKKKILGVP